MLRSLALSTLLIFVIAQTESASAQTSPPLCKEGTWPVRSGGGWVCSKSEATSTDSAKSDSKPDHHGRGGGGSGGFGGMPR